MTWQELMSDQAEGSSESLSNLHNESSGDTPLLACLRECGRRLRWVGDQSSSKFNEYHLLDLLAASGALLRHPFSDSFVRGRSCLSATFGLPMPGGGASPLLFLLVAADRAEGALNEPDLPVDRREMLSEALDHISSQLRTLLDSVESEAALEALEEELFRMHEPTVYRVFGANAKVQCLDLMLRSSRKTLVTHDKVRTAVLATWAAASRYYYTLSLSLFLLCLFCISFSGYIAASDLHSQAPQTWTSLL